MLNPDQLRRFRAALTQDPDLALFEGRPCRRHDLRLTMAAEILFEQPAAPFLRAGPARIFGTPTDSACLNGVGPARRYLPPRRLVRVASGMVIGQSAVLAPNGALFAPDPVARIADLQTLAASDWHGVMIGAGTDGAQCHYLAAQESPSIEADALFLHDLEPGNHGSFLFRVLPQLIFAALAGARFDCYVVPQPSKALRDAIALFGLPDRPIHALADVCGAPFRAVLFSNAFDAEGLLPAPVADRLRSVAMTLPGRGPRALYVSRAAATRARPRYRPLLNEAEITGMAEARGCTAITPEDHDLRDQIALFANATAIAGPSGSGMLNAIFAPIGCKVLDLESVQVTVRQHANLYASSGKYYAFAFGTPIGAGDDTTSPWSIPPAIFAGGLDWLISEGV